LLNLRLRHLKTVALIAALLLTSVSFARAESDVIAKVARLVLSAKVERGGAARSLVVDTALRLGDEVSTGAGARLEITFEDGTSLTLGEKARVKLDRYVYDPEGRADMALSVARGAFLFVTGAMGALADKQVSVSTPLATIGVRGTTFWGGALDNPLDVLLLDGRIEVRTSVGAVLLGQAGRGTTVPAPGSRPTAPTFWPPDKRERAFATVAF